MNKTGDLKLKPKRFVIALFWLISSAGFGQQPGNALYVDPNLSPERCAADLVSRMKLEAAVECQAADEDPLRKRTEKKSRRGVPCKRPPHSYSQEK
jgi:hypothetical protein